MDGSLNCCVMAFDPHDLEMLDDNREVVIETRASGRTFRTVIWIVVDGGEVFVRSVRGPSGKWYQRALVDPEVTILVGDRRLSARAIHAPDHASIDRTSAALRAKYPVSRSLDSMLRAEVLETTMRLEPL